MKQELLEKAVRNTSNVLQPVLDAAYALRPLPKLEIIEIANNVNNALGYSLFEELYYPRLILDFSVVTRAVAQNAVRGSK